MTATPHRVLVADDEEGIRFLWRHALLKPMGAYEVVTGCDGCEAVEAIKQAPFDLLVIDIWMPGMNGVELTEAIRQLGYRVPVIWFTARGVPHMVEKAELCTVVSTSHSAWPRCAGLWPMHWHPHGTGKALNIPPPSPTVRQIRDAPRNL